MAGLAPGQPGVVPTLDEAGLPGTGSESIPGTVEASVQNLAQGPGLTEAGAAAMQGEGGNSGNNDNGNTGVNTLAGGAGDDLLAGGAGADRLDGGVGFNWADYSASSAAVDVKLASSGAQTGGDAQGDILANIENVIGSAHDDFLYGTDEANTMFGGDGVDELRGYGGDDYFSGGNGDDILSGGFGSDWVLYDTASEGVWVDLAGGTGGITNEFDSYDSIENVMGSVHGDTLIGNSEVNTLFGNVGADTLTGGDGADRFVYRTLNDGADTITDFQWNTTDDVFQMHSSLGIKSTNGADIGAFNSVFAVHTGSGVDLSDSPGDIVKFVVAGTSFAEVVNNSEAATVADGVSLAVLWMEGSSSTHIGVVTESPLDGNSVIDAADPSGVLPPPTSCA